MNCHPHILTKESLSFNGAKMRSRSCARTKILSGYFFSFFLCIHNPLIPLPRFEFSLPKSSRPHIVRAPRLLHSWGRPPFNFSTSQVRHLSTPPRLNLLRVVGVAGAWTGWHRIPTKAPRWSTSMVYFDNPLCISIDLSPLWWWFLV